MRTGREDGNALGPDLYYEVRYESLVSKPTEESEKLCEFLGIPYDEAMLRLHEGRERPKPGRSAKRAWLGVTPCLRDWSSKMSAEDVERFEAAAEDLLDELGYPRGRHTQTRKPPGPRRSSARRSPNSCSQEVTGRQVLGRDKPVSLHHRVLEVQHDAA